MKHLIHPQAGITLIEIVIGMAILSSAMIVGSLVYGSIISLGQRSNSGRLVQQGGRYALDVITKNIRNTSTFKISDVDSTHQKDILQLDNVQYTFNPASSQITGDPCLDNGDGNGLICAVGTGPVVVSGVDSVTYTNLNDTAIQIEMKLSQLSNNVNIGQKLNIVTVAELRNK